MLLLILVERYKEPPRTAKAVRLFKSERRRQQRRLIPLRDGVAWCLRQSGWTWAAIGAALEISTTNAHKSAWRAESRICRQIGIRPGVGLPPLPL